MSGTIPPPISTNLENTRNNNKQWTAADRKLANQAKRLKSIIISCLQNDTMKVVIKCSTAREMWNDLILSHEGPSKIRDTKIAALRQKFNAFKSLEGEKVKETYTENVANELENKDVNIPQAEDGESLSSKDEGVYRVKAFMAIVEDEPTVGKINARLDLHYVEDQKNNLLIKFNSLKQELSSCKSELIDLKNTKVHNLTLQHEITRLNLDNESLRDEVYDLKKVIEKWTSSKVTLDQLLTEQVLGNIVRALGRRGFLKDICLKVIFRDKYSSGTEGYGSINYNEITFTKVAYVTGLKYNLFSINQLCDANFKVLFTKTKGTIFNQNNEVVLIAPRRKDVRMSMSLIYSLFIQNHRDHLGKFDEKAVDEFFLRYSPVAKAFRKEMKSTSMEKKSFPYDEFLVPRKPPTQRTRNDDFLPYVHAFDPLSTNNFTIPHIVTSITYNINLSDESPDLSVADDQLVRNEPNELEPSETHVNDNLKV
ncbi:hypothetical protein Tco_1483760 [Tanacetum coccineum]